MFEVCNVCNYRLFFSQCDLMKQMHIYSVATRGQEDRNQWVTSYNIMYSLTGEADDFTYVMNGQETKVCQTQHMHGLCVDNQDL